MASPMRKSTFPLDGSHLDLCVKLIFWSMFGCMFASFGSDTPGLALLIHVVPLKKRGYLKVVYVVIWLRFLDVM